MTVRTLENKDLEGFNTLRTLMCPQRPEAFDTDWHSSIWYWLGTHPLAEEMYRWVVVTGNGEVVGHLAALPQYYRIAGQRVVAHTPASYQVLPGYGRHAVLLMRRLFDTAENCVICNRVPAVIEIAIRLGAKEVGNPQYAVKAPNIVRGPGSLRGIREPIWQLLILGSRAVDRALTATIPVDTFNVEVLEGFDETFDELFESAAAAVPCLTEKDAAFLRWRYGPGSPQASAVLLGVRDGDVLLGYAVLWVTKEGDEGNLLDLTTLPGRHNVARSLLIEAVRFFRRAGVNKIKYRFLTSPISPRPKDLWRLGFVFDNKLLGNKRRSTLLVKFADQCLQEGASDLTHWAYTEGDGEATFWLR